MKRICLFVGLMLCIAMGASAQADHSSILFRNHNSGPVAMNAPLSLSAVRMADSSGRSGNSNYNSSEYKFGRRQRNGGIALTVIGAAFAGAGSALLAVGVPALKRDINGSNTPIGDYVEHGAEVGGGSLGLLVGTPLLISGIVKIVKGSKAMKRAAPGY